MDFVSTVRSLKPAWASPAVKVRELGSGLFNYPLHLVEEDHRKYVVRLFGKNTEYFVDRKIEAENLRRLAPTGLTQNLVEMIEDKRAMMFDYLPGRSLIEEDFKNPDIVRLLVQTFRAIHQSKVTLANECDIFSHIDAWLGKSRESVSSGFAQQDDEILSEFPIKDMIHLVHKIEAYLNRKPWKKTAIHSDLLPGNFILSPDKKRAWVIDWEPGGNGDPAVDVADFITELQGSYFNILSENEEEEIVKIYYGRKWKRMKERVDLYKFVIRLHWSLWANVQYHAYSDVADYGKYSQRNLEFTVRFMQDIKRRHRHLKL